MEKPDPSGTPPASREISISHHLQSLAVDSAHAARHTALARHAGSEAVKDFNLEHVRRHLENLIEDLRKLTAGLRLSMPAVGAELDKLVPLADPDSTADVPERSRAERQAYEETRARFEASSRWGGAI